MKFVWQALGVPIVAELPKICMLEGGDYVPAGKIIAWIILSIEIAVFLKLKRIRSVNNFCFYLGDISYIGCGIRTNQEAIDYLMEKDLFGSHKVAVVKDLFDRCQDRMHLDTYFNIVDNKTCVLSSGVSGMTNPKKRLVDE